MSAAGAAARVALLGASLGLVLVGSEAVLRATGFRYSLAPERVEFGWPDPEVLRELYVPDQDLFWVPRDYPEQIRRMAADPPDLVFLGDSCTEFSHYPEELVALLSRSLGRPLDGQALGVGGWSSWQGRRQLVRDVLPLRESDVLRSRPALATFWFGWNDHWIGFGVEDRMIGGLAARLPDRLRGLRLVDLLERARVAWLALRRGARPLRVPEPDFVENLAAMVDASRAAGVVPVLVTAPTNHRRGREPAYLAERWLPDLAALVPLHRRYVSRVREVARERGAPLCDLAAHFDGLAGVEIPDRWFQLDGIHLTEDGDREAAAALERCLTAHPDTRAALARIER